MATTNDLKNGLVLNIDGQLWTVVEFQHVKPGKGGAFVRTTLKNVLSGKVVDRTFNAGTKVETANVDKRAMTYLYREGTTSSSWTPTPTTRCTCRRPTVGDAANYLLDNAEAVVAVHDGAPLYVELPTSVELVISHTDPGLQGDRSTGGTKPATLETGAEIQVPLFVDHRREGQGRHPRRPLPRPRQRLTSTSVSARSKARKRAVDVLYESDLRGTDPVATLAERVALAEPPVNDYTVELVEGVRASTGSASTRSWPSTPRAGRSTGCPASTGRCCGSASTSCCGATTCPDAVAIDEAVELAKTLSTDESPRFVNGVLARVLRDRPELMPTAS